MMPADFWPRLVIAVLATWRITHLLANEDGPADIIVRLRSRLGNGFWGGLMDCFKCLSLWVAAPAALFVTRRPLELLLTWLAISGAACLLQNTEKSPLIIESGKEGNQNGMLWTEERRTEENTADDNHSRE